ncbi:MAG TPA: TolC family protein [Candidatus Acidoferrales bacterium]|nr:TolC family protein [Candidatus Acidoferrales bacterium]
MKAAMRLALMFALLGACGAAQERPSVPAGTSAAASEDEKLLTMQEAEAIAMRNNPQITVGKLRALQSREFVREARSALMPELNLSVTAVDSNPGSRVAAGSLTNPILFPRAAAGATVNQLITDFGRTTNLVSSSEFHAKAEDQNALATQQDIILAVDEAFYNTLETHALLQVAEDTVKTRQTLVDQVQALTDAKLRSDLDLSFGKVDLARAKLLLLESNNNYEASLSTLSAILGYRDRQNFRAVEPGQEPSAPPLLDATQLIQTAMQQRPEIQAMQSEVTAAEKFGRSEHDLWRPTVNASGVVGQAPVRDDHIPSWYGGVGVNINIPVFNGFLFNARAKSADLETEMKRKKLQDLEDNLARDVRNSWLDTQKAYARLTVTRQLLEEANLALELAQARYKLGLSSIVEFSQAELQKTDADLQDTDAKYQYRLTQILLAYQMGERR